MGLVDGIEKALEKEALKDVEPYAPYIAGFIGGGWVAPFCGDILQMDSTRPLIAGGIAYYVWQTYGPLEAYVVGGALYAYFAYSELKKEFSKK